MQFGSISTSNRIKKNRSAKWTHRVKTRKEYEKLRIKLANAKCLLCCDHFVVVVVVVARICVNYEQNVIRVFFACMNETW